MWDDIVVVFAVVVCSSSRFSDCNGCVESFFTSSSDLHLIGIGIGILTFVVVLGVKQ